MKPFEYMIIAKDNDDVETVLKDTTTFLAKHEDAVRIEAARQIPDGIDSNNVRIHVRAFN